MQKKSALPIFITMLLSSTILSAESILIPTYNTLFTMFPNDTSAINFVMTGCYALSVVIALIVGKVAVKLDYKSLLVFSALVGAVSGIGTFVFINPTVLAVMRALMMIAYTFTNTIAILYIKKLYSDPVKQGKFLGYFVAATMAVSAVFAMISGCLATISLKAAYSLHFLILIYVVALIIVLPSEKKTDLPDQKAQKNEKHTEKMGHKYWSMLLNFAFFNFGFCMIYYYTSIYVAENHLGNEALSGTLNAVCTSCSFVVSLFYGKLTEKCGGRALVGAHVSAIIGCLFLLLYPSVWSAALGIALISFASGFMRVFYYDALPAIVPQSRAVNSVAFLEGFQFFMTCIITYVVSAVMNLFHIRLFTKLLILPLFLFICTAVIAYFFQKKSNFQLGR